MDLRFDDADELVDEAETLAPGHPLCNTFRVAVMLSRIQEGLRAEGDRYKISEDYFQEVDKVIRATDVEIKAHPLSPYPRMYQGAAYGCRGLANLYRGRYVTSYFDGKKGAGLLKEAFDQDPTIYNAYFGMGQFEYYCGRLAGVLQFMLALRGDEKKGLAMLATCADKGTYSAWACRGYRLKLVLIDQKDYKGAEADLVSAAQRYPHAYDFQRGLLSALMADSKPSPALLDAGQALFQRIEAGWKAPAHVQMPLDPGRLALAKGLATAGRSSDALQHYSALLHSADKDIAALAKAGLDQLPR